MYLQDTEFSTTASPITSTESNNGGSGYNGGSSGILHNITRTNIVYENVGQDCNYIRRSESFKYITHPLNDIKVVLCDLYI